MMADLKQTWLNEEPHVVEALRNLPEGSGIPNFEPENEIYLFLDIEGEGKDSQLVLLTNNEYGDPIKEYHPLSEVKYFREDGQPDIIALLRGFGWSKPQQEVVNPENYEKYSKMLNEVAAK